MNADGCIRSLDKLEVNRKADYSIWGYLYQFDLTLYDMLCHNTENDLFNDEPNSSKATYQIEVIEDYIKTFSLLNKDYIRIAQVKYSSLAKDFNNWGVIIDLYYDYLYLSNMSEGDINIKCAIIFNTIRKVSFEKQQIIDNGKEIIGNFISIYMKEVAMSSVNINEDNHNKRVINILNKYHSEIALENFLNHSLIIHWEEQRQKLINLIKVRLDKIFNDEFINFSNQNKKDILYSLSISFIIDKWQSKKSKIDTVEIKIDDIINYVKEIVISEEKVITYSIINNIKEAIDQNLKEITWTLLKQDKDKDEEKVKVLLQNTYYKYADKLFEKLSVILKDKLNRCKLLNTISLNEFIGKEEYFKLSLIEEYVYFSKKQVYLESYINRILKFINQNVENGINSILDINIMLDFNNDILFFKHPLEKRSCVLLPNTIKNPEYDHEMVLERINQSKIKPKVWYFDKLDIPNPVYDLNIFKPKSVNIDIKEPYDDKYYIECMECLDLKYPFENGRISCIFCERCKLNGQSKDRESFD
ncbi:MAG TPA: hypothetical protein VIM70_08645 [Clostridium sp.]|uniref:hypothetical protein n=1 Tax=Clostridium sp. TaxID=1506 RepID=UPI002F950374